MCVSASIAQTRSQLPAPDIVPDARSTSPTRQPATPSQFRLPQLFRNPNPSQNGIENTRINSATGKSTVRKKTDPIRPKRSVRSATLVVQAAPPQQIGDSRNSIRLEIRNTGNELACNTKLSLATRGNLEIVGTQIGLREDLVQESSAHIHLGYIKPKQKKIVTVFVSGQCQNASDLKTSIRYDKPSYLTQRPLSDSIQLVVTGPSQSGVGETFSHLVSMVNQSDKVMTDLKLTRKLPASFHATDGIHHVSIEKLAPSEKRTFVFRASGIQPDFGRLRYKIVRDHRSKTRAVSHQVTNRKFELSLVGSSHGVSQSLYRYKIIMTNTSSRQLNRVIVRLRTPRNFQIKMVDRNSLISRNKNLHEFFIPRIAPGETKTIQYFGSATQPCTTRQSVETIIQQRTQAKTELQTKFRDPEIKMWFSNQSQLLQAQTWTTVRLNLQNRENAGISNIKILVSLPANIEVKKSGFFRRTGSALLLDPLTLPAHSKIELPITIRANHFETAKIVAQIQGRVSRLTKAQRITLVAAKSSPQAAEPPTKRTVVRRYLNDSTTIRSR